MNIQDWTGSRLSIENPDGYTSMADLAKFIEFDPKAGEYEHSSAFNAILDAHSALEAPDCQLDYYDGFHVTFADGSTLSYQHN